VAFLGLYDAVDMALGLDGERITNVDATYHARRDPRLESRSSWGNTGMRSDGFYEERVFFTSHGGIGGDPTLTPSSITDDFSCNTRGLRADIMRSMGTDPGQMCRLNGRAADEWIRRNARSRNVPV
jgi:hypothetical protein